MYFHVRISQRSNTSHDEVKLDLSKEQLEERIIAPYNQGVPLIINGKSIAPDDIERVRISESREPARQLIEQIKYEDRESSFMFIGGPSYEWQAADRANDVTDNFIMGPPGSSKQLPAADTYQNEVAIDVQKVFVVHGHDHALKTDVEVFLKEIGLESIVLHRQIDEGLTVVEKFEKHSDVGFAVVLLTPDDIGYPRLEAEKIEAERDIEFRARQNVVFELGFFIGKLGRSKVICIYKEGVTLPSDLNGFIYKKVITSVEEVAYSIIKEFQHAGLPVKL